MEKPIENYWGLRLNRVKAALTDNNFDVFLAGDTKEAVEIVQKKIIPDLNPGSVSWGGSMTFTAIGLYDAIKNSTDFDVLDTYAKLGSREEVIELRRKALLVDLFFTGTNAVTESGMLVNLDMIGNRVGALTFGPKNVIVLTGRNKIVADLDEAMSRIKEYVAPANAMRLDMKTPCVSTGSCEDCRSASRICNTWTITEKSYPRGRVKIILINKDLGL